MNFEYFIAKRILQKNPGQKAFSRPVVRISVWAIAIGMIIMILALATGNGLRKEIRSKITGFGGHIQILNYQPGYAYEQKPVQLSDSLLAEIEREAGVEYLQSFGRKAGILKKEDLFEGVVLKGVSADYNWQYFEPYILEGTLPVITDTAYSEQVLISEKLADKLKLTVDDKVKMFFVRPAPKPPLLRYFKISGVYRTDFEEIDNNFIVGDIKHVVRLNKWKDGQVGGYEVFLGDEDLMAGLSARLREILPFQLDALTARELHPQIYQWVKLFDLNIVIVLVIMVLVATINMSIALLTIILERTMMIGILKSLGSSTQQVQRIFLIHAAQLIFRGLLWGNLIGVGVAFLQKQTGLIKLDPSTYYVSEVSIDLNIWHILALNAGTMLVCLIALLLPSLLISRITPVKAIRFD